MIMIDNLNVDDNAPIGTTIGMLTATDAAGGVIACDFTLTKGSRGYFAISSNSLITAWVGSITPGYCSVRVRANGTSTRFSASATSFWFGLSLSDASKLAFASAFFPCFSKIWPSQ